jgi:hypothetical protein
VTAIVLLGDKSRIRVITNLPNSAQSYKGKVKTHKYIKNKISQQPENYENRNDPDLVQAFLKKWWVESDFRASNKEWEVFTTNETYPWLLVIHITVNHIMVATVKLSK